MNQDTLQGEEKYTKAHQRKRRWYKVVTSLACVVVFCTVYALILPAITMEKKTCGIAEHTHTDNCYTQVTSITRKEPICTAESLNLHQHEESCWDTEGNLICGSADFVVHRHDSNCYDEDGNLWCPLTEIEEHQHNESCYMQPETTDGDQTAESVENPSVEKTQQEPICGKEEITLHTHQPYVSEEEPGCYMEDEEGLHLICGKLQILEHQHTDDCFRTAEEAVDTDTLTCTLPEDENHTHNPRCYGTWELTCEMEEHTHSEACQEGTKETETSSGEQGTTADETAAETNIPAENETISSAQETQTELIYKASDYTVTVSYGSEAALPDGVTLEVEEIPADSEEYQTYLSQTTTAMDKSGNTDPVVFARFFDIQFLLDGEKVEPAGPVEVTITYDQDVKTNGDASCQAVHFAEDGTELLDVVTEQKEDGTTSFTHTQDSFSVVGDVVTESNPADAGPDSLPVDYYVCIDGTWTCVGSTKTGWYNNWDGSEDWTDYNRDYITVEQAVSILEPYGFKGNESNPSRVTAYQQKSGGNTNVYSDTDTVKVTISEDSNEKTKILPLSRNTDHAGYNLYYLPNNSTQINGVASPDSLDKTANGFYTVKVYDANGVQITSEIVKTGGSFTYDATASGVTEWLVAYENGNTTTINGSSITINNITSTVTVSPKQGDVGNHSVTFKVMIDGAWETVGSLPYYYTGNFGDSQRAYITSEMAAQMLGDYGYTAQTDPGYHFGYSYNDIYTIFYANGSTKTDFCMDIDGGNLQEAQVVQLYTSNGTDAQVFRVRDAGNGYSFITPIGNSAFHVNVYEYTEGTGTLQGTQLKLSSATNANSKWKVDTGTDGRTTFWSALAPDDQVIDLSGANMTNGGKLQVYSSTGGARYWYMVQQYRIYNDTVSAQNADGTWNIGLTLESNGDIVCYYMPKETTNEYSKATESAINTKNSLWSVTVRDDTHTVYSNGDLSNMVTVVEPGGEATVTVRNADGILWSCAGKNGKPVEVESSQSDGYTTFVIENITQPVEVVATKADPTFTVQYYANIDHYVMGDSGNLEVIDTSGGKLPQNTSTQSLRKLTLENIGQNTNQNHGNKTSLNRVKSEKQLTQMYTDGTYNFAQHPGLEYFDKLWEQSNYKLDAVLVLKDGKSPDSTNDDDWWWYQVNQETWSNITFTNLASEEKAPKQEGVKQGRDGTYCILLKESTVIRLRYEVNNQTYTNQAYFHDYDITSGQNPDGTWRSGITGINLSDNYVTSGNGERKFNGTHDAGAAADTFAFGNANCATGLGLAQWDGNNINSYNSNSYKGCTFGLVTGLSGDGNLVWDPWITAPRLFNEGTANGKYSYKNGSLQFVQTGDTYTLTAADSSVGSRDNLEYFFNPSPSSSTTHTHIFTNNFWPMDSATNKTDPLMGAINDGTNKCDILVNGFWDEQNKVGDSHNGMDVPISDDGQAHNWFFGMNFSLSFTLTEDYLGPLEYLFFGDDDMWVFLDDKLICDIGGVHSSVGEYVNLRDYLPNGSSGQHTLSFFYTERGASGSTCWMSFTLPSVTSAATGQDIGGLQIGKQVEDTGGADFSGEEYKFRVELLTSEDNGSGLDRTFSYMRSDGTYGTVKNGGTITLHQNETATIKGIPAGSFYRVTELTTEGYHTIADGKEGIIASGKIEDGITKPAAFVNRPYFELPASGGPGTILYTMGGLLLMIAASLLLYIETKRRKKSANGF
ncbi:MAG: fibro-slime domain-containing protein [Lachnospiraceae bacterium]